MADDSGFTTVDFLRDLGQALRSAGGVMSPEAFRANAAQDEYQMQVNAQQKAAQAAKADEWARLRYQREGMDITQRHQDEKEVRAEYQNSSVSNPQLLDGTPNPSYVPFDVYARASGVSMPSVGLGQPSALATPPAPEVFSVADVLKAAGTDSTPTQMMSPAPAAPVGRFPAQSQPQGQGMTLAPVQGQVLAAPAPSAAPAQQPRGVNLQSANAQHQGMLAQQEQQTFKQKQLETARQAKVADILASAAAYDDKGQLKPESIRAVVVADPGQAIKFAEYQQTQNRLREDAAQRTQDRNLARQQHAEVMAQTQASRQGTEAEQESLAKAVANYDIASAELARMPNRGHILALAVKYNPDFKEQYYYAAKRAETEYASGTGDGGKVSAIATAKNHLNTMRDLTKALKTGDLKAANAVRAWFLDQTGSPLGTNIEAAAPVVGNEIIKAVAQAGVGTEDERKQAASNFSTSKSPDQMAGAADKLELLMEGKKKVLFEKYRHATRKPKDYSEAQFDEQFGFTPTAPTAPSGAGKTGVDHSNPLLN